MFYNFYIARQQSWAKRFGSWIKSIFRSEKSTQSEHKITHIIKKPELGISQEYDLVDVKNDVIYSNCSNDISNNTKTLSPNTIKYEHNILRSLSEDMTSIIYSRYSIICQCKRSSIDQERLDNEINEFIRLTLK